MRTFRSRLFSFLRHLALAAVLVNLLAVRSAHADALIGPTGGANATLPGSSPLLVQGPTCVGSSVCVNGENFFPGIDLKLKDTVPTLKFEDATAPAGSHASWFLIGNFTTPDGFTIAEQPAGQTNITSAPFTVLTGSHNNSLVVGPNAVGFGTLNPLGNGTSIHIFGDVASDVFSGLGPNPITGPAFNFGYSGHSFERSSGFFNVRPDASALAPNPSLRFATANVQRMIIDNVGNVGIGQFGATVTPPNRGTSPLEKLHVQGNVRADGNFISNGTTLTVPDYVFDPDYKLLPLKQLAAYVEKEKHLPQVPSAHDIKANGINLSAMQMNLLQKVEELTLYTLQQEDTIQNQGKTISTQSKTISTLRQANKAQQDALAALAARVEALEQVQSAAAQR